MMNDPNVSESRNKALVANYYAEVVATGDCTHLDRFVAADYRDHNAPEGPIGREAVRAHLAALRTTFPDFSLTVHELIAEGDFVVTRVSGSGTHLGEWMGIQPSGKKISLRGINIDRLTDGLISEHWGEADTVGMLMQMGVDPFVGRGL